MSDREPQLPPWAQRRPGERRPTWVAVLTFCMLAFGGHLLMGGLTIWRGLGTPPPPPGPAAMAAAAGDQQALMRELRAMTRALEHRHPVAVRVNAASKIAMALVLLFAVAAVLAWDRRGRAATLAAAWAGIGYHVGDGLYLALVVREGVMAAAPSLAAMVAAQGGAAGASPPSADDLVAFARTFMLVVSVVTAAVGIGFSLLLLVFFGGRRGRTFYGLERQPSHGG